MEKGAQGEFANGLGSLPIEEREILRYLGYKRSHQLTPELIELVTRSIKEVQEITAGRFCYQIFDLKKDWAKESIQVVGTDLQLTDQSSWRHLANASQVAFMVATLGGEVEQVIARYEITDLTYSLVLDCACSDYIEKICDLAQAKISWDQEAKGLALNRRFSPGYGKLPLAVQPYFLQGTNAQRLLGISLTKDYLMIPRKSVTAMIGLFEGDLAKPSWKSLYDKSWQKVAERLQVGGVK